MEKNPGFGTRGCGLPRGKWITLFMLMLSFIMTSMTLTPWGTSTARAGTVALPKTGQVTCYDEAGTEISCTGTGQDGEIQAGVAWPDPRFTDNGDGTIRDNLTQLIWLQDPVCMATTYPELDTDGTAGTGDVTWVNADDFVNKIDKGTYPLCGAGQTDWRVPNIVELESLFHAGMDYESVVDWLMSGGFLFPDSPSSWSSTTSPYNSGNASDSGLDGTVGFYPKTYESSPWPVRGTTSGPAQLWQTGQTTAYVTRDDGDLREGAAWPDPRYTNNGDGTITDNLTGLTWLRDANCIHTQYPAFDTDGGGADGGVSGDGRVTWQHALDFVRGINSGTYSGCGASRTDWRLPNRKELMSLFHYGMSTQAWLLGRGFENIPAGAYYWSSTTRIDRYEGNTEAWAAIIVGDLLNYYKSDSFYVWPVRGGAILERISTPSTPSGPTTGVTGVSYNYSTGDSISNLGSGHPIEYQFNWGDQTTSEWSSSGSASHSWSLPGIYNITAQARCTINNEVISSWSGELSITIASEHISAPSILSGTTLGWTATLYSFSAGNSVSTFEHPVEYQFDWGDQTLSEWSSSGSASHSWSSPGIYNITAQARCTINNEVISSWSGELSVTINPPPGPDLTGTWTYLTQTCKTSKSGTKCKIKGELKTQNVGDQDASSSVVKFYLSDDKAYDEGDTFLKKATVGKMKAKAGKTTRLTYNLTGTALDKYIIAVIDAGNTVTEQYETNNNIVFGPIL